MKGISLLAWNTETVPTESRTLTRPDVRTTEQQVFISCQPFPLPSSYLCPSPVIKALVSPSALDPRPWDPRTFPSTGPPLHHSVRRTINIEPCHSFPMSCRTPAHLPGAQGTSVCVCVYIKRGTSASMKQIEEPARDCCVQHLCVCIFFPKSPRAARGTRPSASLRFPAPPPPHPALSHIHECDQLLCLPIGAQFPPDIFILVHLLVHLLVLHQPTHGEEPGTVHWGLWLLHAARERRPGLFQ